MVRVVLSIVVGEQEIRTGCAAVAVDVHPDDIIVAVDGAAHHDVVILSKVSKDAAYGPLDHMQESTVNRGAHLPS